jgi:hypothetical protein
MRSGVAAFWGVVATLALHCSPAAGQQQENPVLAHYHAYRAALETGDRALAETEAAAALAASEARDGDGGRTAVLAYNLADLRLNMGRAAEALAPAQRASALAQARGAESGVDPLLASLVLGQAELAAEQRGAGERLATAVRAAAAQGGPAPDLFPAATALAGWALNHGRYDLAREAYSIAASFPEGSAFEPEFARAHATTGVGAATFLRDLNRMGALGSAAEEIHSAFVEAKAVLAPAAEIDAPGGEMTVAQQAYALAIAWDSALKAKLQAEHLPIPHDPKEAEGDADGATEFFIAADDPRPRCLLDYRLAEEIRYPRRALDQLQIGAVVLRLLINEEGVVVDQKIAAKVGSTAFSSAVERAGPWIVKKLDGSAPDCRMAMSVFITVRFVMA